MDWSSTMFLRIDVQLNDTAGGQFPAGQPLFQLGVDGSLAAFPLNACCSTMTATINDTTVVINSQDVLTEVLRLTDYKENRLQRTCPTMLDKYQSNADGLNATNDPISGYSNMSHDYHEQPNGSFPNVVFTDPSGRELVGTSGIAGALPYTFGGLTVDYIDGVPVSTNQAVLPAVSVNGLYSVFLKIRSTEKLVLSPFVFAEKYAADTGLFGINNIQLVMNMRDPNRAIRLRDSVTGTATKEYYGGVFNNPAQWTAPVSYNSNVATGAFRDSVVNVQFLTPSLDIPLPPKSVVPYMEFPRYITQPQNTTIPSGESVQLQSQTITLPQIPDLLIIYCKAIADPAVTSLDKSLDPAFPQFGASYLPIDCGDLATRGQAPLSINFDNFSGLLSSHTAEQLYHMCVKNGLEMDYDTWCGRARIATGPGGALVATVGGFLVLKPGIDVTLQSGQAPSLVGNFTLQFNVRVRNTFGFSVQPQIYVITANSGFFESIRGSSRIIKGVLSEQDIIGAPLAPGGTRESLKRLIGGNVLALANRMGMVKSGMTTKKEEEKKGGAVAVGGAMRKSGLASRLM